MIPFHEAITQWLDGLELSSRSKDAYAYRLRSVATFTNGYWPSGEDLRRWQQSIKNQSATTRHHKTKTVRMFFAWAAEELQVSNPARRLPVPRRPKQLPQTLTEEEWDKLESGKLRLPYRKGERYLAARDLTIVRLIMFTGLRRQEVANLTVGDVDVTHQTVRVNDGKGSRDRVVAYPDKLDLSGFVRGRRPAEPLFTKRKSKQPFAAEGIGAMFQHKLSPALGRRLHAHLLRHAYATYLCRKGAPLRDIQTLLGHSSLATTQIYLDVTQANLRQTVHLFDE